MKATKAAVAAAGLALLWSTASFAAHPLITDDPDTQGKGKFQVELNVETSADKEPDPAGEVKTTESEIATILSYGIAETADFVVGAPYRSFTVKQGGVTAADESGLSDVSLELKWQFYEKDGLSFAVKPGVSLPTGNDDKGLGAGKVAYSGFIIASRALEPWRFLANLGYIRNENTGGERNDLWHAHMAAIYQATGRLKAVANIGTMTNPEKNAGKDPAFLLGGVIYAITEDFDVDFGVKWGITDPETDVAYLAGMAVRF